MSSMNNLDLIVKENSVNEAEYEEAKEWISRHMNGEVETQDLPQHVKDILFQWECEEMELMPRDIPQPWEDHDG